MTTRDASAVLALARAGDLAGAIGAGEALLENGLRDPGLAMFIGMLCGREGDLARGVPHLRRAVEFAPAEIGPKVELARALMATGSHAEAEAVSAPFASPASPAGREMQRIQAHALYRGGNAVEAAALFEPLTDADAADFESWGGLGAARLGIGDIPGAIAALERATTLQPAAVGPWTNLARAHAAANDFDAAVGAAEAAVTRDAHDAAAQLELGRALAGAKHEPEALAVLGVAQKLAADNAAALVDIGDLQFTCKAPEAAEASFRAALAADPDRGPALLGLGKVAERLNRTDELVALLARMADAGISDGTTALMRACALRNQGKIAEALATAQAAPAEPDPIARAQLVGDLADRLGQADIAFAAFDEAARLLAAINAGSDAAAAAYLDGFKRVTAILTPEWYASWTAPAPLDRQPPLFIFGFPRSGTTLIDTMLSGHPDALVLEESPVIDRVAEALGPLERLPELGYPEIQALRDLYFAEVARFAGEPAGRLIVDKHPLGLGNTALLHRLFPEARFVFVERHPCDVVLSCFITSSRMSANVASFFDFVGTAQLYDQVLSFWTRARAVLPIAVHTIRYEALVADPETELRRLAEFAGLRWDERLLANQENASARRYIGSPSYSQVAEPIYTRARGRWLRYREHMAGVLPILRPWAERLGYEMD